MALQDLASHLGLESLPADWLIEPDFPLLVPQPYLSRIEPGNASDPLLLQVLPLAKETISVPGFNRDPLGESDFTAPRGLLHKYQGRILVITTGNCAINCRYCFRRHFPYTSSQPDNEAWKQIFSYLDKDSSITEVILSGGDPLVLKDQRLAWITDALSQIRHIKRLRIHTRLPVVIPQRVTHELLDWISGCSMPVTMVIHSNHPRELDEHVAAALAKLKGTGMTLFNQSVLLAAVNDSADVLTALSERLSDMGVLPYYLHLLDRVEGAGHFDVPMDKALRIYRQLSSRLPGYLVPKLVKEEPGESAKTQIVF
jgi:EF-P beta-lysylation protein EpmB